MQVTGSNNHRSNRLSIQLSLGGLSICGKASHSVELCGGLLNEEAKQIILEEAKTFEKCEIIVASPLVMAIPFSLYDENLGGSYLLSKGVNLDESHTFFSEVGGIIFISAIDLALYDLLNENFQSLKCRHILSKMTKKSVNHQGDNVKIFCHKNYSSIVSSVDGEVAFCNTLPYQNGSDIIYYLATLAIDESTLVEICGCSEEEESEILRIYKTAKFIK